MLRLIGRLAPPALMGLAFWVYSDHFEAVDRSLEWREHTYEARSLAERIARDAGCPPHIDRLAADLDGFARTTADNPAQVARVALMRRAMDPLDAARVAGLADAAIEEEDRLLPARKAAAGEKISEIRGLALRVFLLAIGMAVVQAVVDFLFRATEPRVTQPKAGRTVPTSDATNPPPPIRGPRPGGDR